MSAREELARIIGGKLITRSSMTETADAILAAGWRPPARTVTTKEELEALPDGSIIGDSAGDVAEKRGGVWCAYETAPMTNARLAKYTPITVLHEARP